MSLSPPKCLALVRKATNDNERLAALLVVAKHCDSSKLTDQYYAELLDAITIEFFCRLLRSAKSDTEFLQICHLLGSVLLYNESLIDAVISAELIDIFVQNVGSLEAIQCNVLICKWRKNLINIELCRAQCIR